MIRILLCGEGNHEIGDKNLWNEKTRTREAVEGWMQAMGRRICSDIEFLIRRRNELNHLPRNKSPLPAGHGTKALAAKLAAGQSGCDVVVFMLDCDSADPAEWARKRAEVQAGFDCYDNQVLGLVCIPMATSESWFLADSAAWKSVSGNDPALPSKPESIWGQRDNPMADHPHRYFARACDSVGLPDRRETRVALAQATNLDTLASRCPTSFGGFRSDIHAARERLASRV